MTIDCNDKISIQSMEEAVEVIQEGEVGKTKSYKKKEYLIRWKDRDLEDVTSI